MSGERDIDRVVRSWLHEDRHEDATRVLDSVLVELDTAPQRRSSWAARRFPTMNNMLRVGLVTAAVVIIAVIALNFLPGSPGPGSEPTPKPSTAAAATAEPASYNLTTPEIAPIRLVLTLPAGWAGEEWNVETTDVALGLYPVDNVYGDPCHWQGSLPDPPVGTTVDDLATALANQPTRDATVDDVTLGGYRGKVVHMSVPADINFGDCDLGQFANWSEAGLDTPSRYAQGPGQLEDVYILDVHGTRVVLDASWLPSAPAADLAALNDMLATLTIQP